MSAPNSRPDGEGRRQREPRRVAVREQQGGDGSAGREAGVDGEIGEVEDPEREIHADGHEGERQAEGDRATPDAGAGVAGHRDEDHAEGDGADGVGEEAAGG